MSPAVLIDNGSDSEVIMHKPISAQKVTEHQLTWK